MKERLGQKLVMHLNGGCSFSTLQYAITLDGEATKMGRTTKTDGRPDYRVTSDLFYIDDQEFDALATKREGLLDWIIAQLEAESEASTKSDT